MHISEAGGRVVAADIETAFNSVDLAILDVARLTARVMEVQRSTVVAPAQFQHVADAISESLLKITEGRKAMVAAHRSLALFKERSNLATVDFGCFAIGAGNPMPDVNLRL